MDATCKTCPFFVMFAGVENEGTCRRHPPQPMMTESGGDHAELTHETSVVSPYWFCGEHPLRQRDRLAAMAMQGWLSSWPPDRLLSSGGAALADAAYAAADAMLQARASPAPTTEERSND